MDLSKYRTNFPMLAKKMHGKPLVYLDSAATAQKPQLVIDTVKDFYQDHYGTVHRAVYGLAAYSTAEYQSVRQKVKAFLNAAKEEEILFTRGTTESINLAAFSFGKAFVHPGDEIMISEMEHHSNIVPWQMLCEERGAVLKVIPINDRGEIQMEAYQKILSPKTKLVAIAHMSNALGTINPVKEMIRMAHAAGAKVLVDGAQSVPHMVVDVQDLDADFFVFSGHKLYGPTGVGVLYGKEDLLQRMPPYQGGGDMIQSVTFQKTTYNVLPMKFEAGTPMIAEVIGLGAAIDYINSVGLDRIADWENQLLEYATQQLQEIPHLRIIGTAERKGSIISFVVENVHPLDIGTMMDAQGIAIRTGQLCVQPLLERFGLTGMSRASFAFYNTKEDVDRFIAALKNIISLLYHA